MGKGLRQHKVTCICKFLHGKVSVFFFFNRCTLLFLHHLQKFCLLYQRFQWRQFFALNTTSANTYFGTSREVCSGQRHSKRKSCLCLWQHHRESHSNSSQWVQQEQNLLATEQHKTALQEEERKGMNFHCQPNSCALLLCPHLTRPWRDVFVCWWTFLSLSEAHWSGSTLFSSSFCRQHTGLTLRNLWAYRFITPESVQHFQQGF